MMRKNMGFASRKEGLYWLPPYWATRGHPHRANRWRRLAERLRRRKPANSLGPSKQTVELDHLVLQTFGDDVTASTPEDATGACRGYQPRRLVQSSAM